MNELRFDMHRIGHTIARLRRERNMTQMALADLMNVSYQAVSNWERGQSMPDISKLPELAEMLETTIDELLGRSAPIITHAAQGTLTAYVQEKSVSLEEVAEAAPILAPEQVEQLTDHLLGPTDAGQDTSADATSVPGEIRFHDLTALLPFLSTEKVDLLLRDRAARGESIASFLPFASNGLLEALAEEAEANGDRQRFAPIVPFLHKELLEKITFARIEAGSGITDLVPFLYTETVNRIALDLLRKGESIQHLLPFIGQGLLDRLVEAAAKA